MYPEYGGNVVGVPEIAVNAAGVGPHPHQPQHDQPMEYQSSMSMAKVQGLTEREKLLEAVRQASTQQQDQGAADAAAPSSSLSSSQPQQPDNDDQQQQSWQDQLEQQSREGYFTMSFPHLFPTGAAEFNIPRLGRSPPSLLAWAAHLTRLQFDETEESGGNRFVLDWRFVHLVTSIHLG